MGSPDKDIERKLQELELSLKETADDGKLSVADKKAEVTVDGAQGEPMAADLMLTAGCGLLLLGIMLFLQHIRISTPYMISWFGWGQGGFGLLLIPLMIGIGLLLYDYKNRLGWVLTAASLAVVGFAVLSQLVMTFAPLSMLGLIIMLLPLAAGAALVARGVVHKQSGTQVGK